MTQEKFGEPGRGDATANRERIINNVATQAAQRLNRVGPNVLNRGVDTHPISKEDQIVEYMALKQDPKFAAETFQAIAADPSMGVKRAKLQWYRMEKRMRKEMENA